jgi:hypothetical protein
MTEFLEELKEAAADIEKEQAKAAAKMHAMRAKHHGK